MESLCRAVGGEQMTIVIKDGRSVAAVFETALRWTAADVLPTALSFDRSRYAVRCPGKGRVILLNGERPGSARGYDRRATMVEPGVDAWGES